MLRLSCVFGLSPQPQDCHQDLKWSRNRFCAGFGLYESQGLHFFSLYREVVTYIQSIKMKMLVNFISSLY